MIVIYYIILIAGIVAGFIATNKIIQLAKEISCELPERNVETSKRDNTTEN